MANRYLAFGYKIADGKLCVEETEAELVKAAFSLYAAGKSYSQIAERFTLSGIRYNIDSDKWNKNMVKRIIENNKYIGRNGYPQIIEEKLYLMSDRMREAIYQNANGEISTDELDRICLEVKMESQRLRQENKEYEMERKMKSTESSKLKLIFKAIDGMDDKVCEIDTLLIRSIIERYEVVSKKKMIIWFIGDIPYEVDLPE